MLRISLQLDTLCTSAVRRYCAISGISPFTYRLFSRVRLSDFMEAEKLATKYSDLSLVNFLLCRALQHKLYWQLSRRWSSEARSVLLHCWLGQTRTQ